MLNIWGTPHVPEGLEGQAACLPASYPNRWVPVTLRGQYVDSDADAAMKVCNTLCAIREACLDHALNNGDVSPRIIGGTDRERREAMLSALSATKQSPERTSAAAILTLAQVSSFATVPISM